MRYGQRETYHSFPISFPAFEKSPSYFDQSQSVVFVCHGVGGEGIPPSALVPRYPPYPAHPSLSLVGRSHPVDLVEAVYVGTRSLGRSKNQY